MTGALTCRRPANGGASSLNSSIHCFQALKGIFISFTSFDTRLFDELKHSRRKVELEKLRPKTVRQELEIQGRR